MVSSGLVERTDVSHYRLALHLGLAILILGALLWLALSLGREQPQTPERRVAPGLRWGAGAVLALVFLQVELGALVAGLKAGLAHNTWPLMDGRLIPEGLGVMRPWYANIFENAMTVQFNHRVAAYVLVLAALAQAWAVARAHGTALARRSGTILAGAVLAQAALGIWTLLAHVPLSLGLAHQAGAAIVFALGVWHLFVLQRA
jgi:cytochrome c oxidase assembly protein subunit 15